MNKSRHFTVVIIGTSAVIIAVTGAALIWSVLVPHLVEKRIILELKENGFSDISMDVRFVSHRMLLLNNFRISRNDSLEMETQINIHKSILSFDLFSLIHGQIREIAFSDIHIVQRLGITDSSHDTVSLIHKLENGIMRLLSSTSGMNVRLKRLLIKNARITLIANNEQSVTIPLTAEMKLQSSDQMQISLDAGIGDKQINSSFSFTADRTAQQSSCRFTAVNVNLSMIRNLLLILMPEAKLPFTGSGGFDAHGQIDYRQQQWSISGVMTGNKLSLQPSLQQYTHPVSIDTIKFGFYTAETESSDISFCGSYIEAPVRGTIRFSLPKMQGYGTARIQSLDAQALRSISESPVSSLCRLDKIAVNGSLDIDLHIQYTQKRFVTNATISASPFHITASVGSSRMSLFPETAAITARGTLQNTGLEIQSIRVAVKNILGKSIGLEGRRKKVTFSIPNITLTGNKHNGSFSFSSIAINNRTIPRIAGTYACVPNKLSFKARSALFPGADLFANGSVDWKKKPVTGMLSLKIPRFFLNNTAFLGKLFPEIQPEIQKDTIQGIFAAQMRLSYDGVRFTKNASVTVFNATWHRPAAGVFLEGVCGTVAFDRFTPPRTIGSHHISIKKATVGSFSAHDAKITLTMGHANLLSIDSFVCSWAGGTLRSSAIVLDNAVGSVRCTLYAQSINIQEILDMFKYREVQVSGTLQGHIPIAIQLNTHRRLWLGQGYLEAQLPRGAIQFTEKTAGHLLGMNRQHRNNKQPVPKEVEQMMIDALQDMVYTTLRVSLKENIDNATMAQIFIQGYSPKKEKRNQVPIGGFTVNVHNVALLLNTFLFSKINS